MIAALTVPRWPSQPKSRFFPTKDLILTPRRGTTPSVSITAGPVERTGAVMVPVEFQVEPRAGVSPACGYAPLTR